MVRCRACGTSIRVPDEAVAAPLPEKPADDAAA
jgi:hypothetical protein